MINVVLATKSSHCCPYCIRHRLHQTLSSQPVWKQMQR